MNDRKYYPLDSYYCLKCKVKQIKKTRTTTFPALNKFKSLLFLKFEKRNEILVSPEVTHVQTLGFKSNFKLGITC